MRVAVAFALALAGCGSMQSPPPPEFKFAVTVESDPKVPLAGASIMRSGKELAKTDATGKATMTFQGAEGDTFDLYVQCPAEYLAPAKPISVRLSRLSDDKVMGETVRCSPQKRTVVIAVRAEGGPNLPVTYFGREIARTDGSGAASFSLTGKPGETLQFVLDTSDKSYERLRPQSPMLSVLIKDQDDVYLVDQPFQQQKIITRFVPRPQPRPIGPQPLH